jgi:hypothetical protein
MPTATITRPLRPSRALVDTAEEREHYWQELLALFEVRGRRASSATFFPGANPVSLGRADLGALRAHRHVLALKSDGVRFALLLTVRPGTADEPVALMVDRARNMYEVEVAAAADFFLKRTVLEGELVWRQPEERSLLFLVFDAVVVKGESLLAQPFERRLEAARRCTQASEDAVARAADEAALHADLDDESLVLVQYAPPTIAMRPKVFVGREHAARVWAERAAAEHRVDGLVLLRADAPYRHGTATGAAFKWKPVHSIDLAGPPDALRAADGPLPASVGGLRVEVDRASRIATAAEGEVCEYHVEADEERGAVRLFAMRRRSDKATANGLRVIAATVRDARERLQVDELAAA